MRNDQEFVSVHTHLKKRLNQKRRTGMSIASFLLHHLRQYAIYPDEMSVKFKDGKLKVKLVDSEDKTKWFHKREEYRTQLNQKLEEMDYKVVVKEMKVL